MTEETATTITSKRLTIKGWHNDEVCEIAIPDANQVACARQIIAAECTAIEAKLKAVAQDTSGDSGLHGDAFEASKTRAHFDLSIAEMENAKPLGAWRKNFVQSFDKAVIRDVPAGRTLSDWMSARYLTGSQFIAIGTPGEKAATFLAKGGYRQRVKLPGEGKAEVSKSHNPQRTRPQKDSLAHWLSTTQLEARAEYVGYILDSSSGRLDCDLLRRRLTRSQIVCARPGSEAEAYLRTLWDGDILQWPEFVVFAQPGLRFLDPVLLTPDEISRIKWPKVSVVTVSYNQGQFLEECLDSVLDQGYPNLEYIVVDAVSTDGSVEILKRYESRLTKLVIEPDKGQSDGLNKGLGLATGDILTWINSDDALAPGALLRGALAMLDFDSDLVTGGCRRITEKPGEILFDHHPAIPYARAVPLGFIEQFMWTTSWEHGDYFFQPEVLFSAETWRRSGGYLKLHLYWAMDWELWIRMALAGATVSHIPEFIGCSREHPDQKTTSDQKYLHQLINILLEYDDAFAALPGDLAAPASAARQPQWLQLASNSEEPSAGIRKYVPMPLKRVAKKLLSLRDPVILRAAIRNRVPERIVRMLRMRRDLHYRYTGYTVVNRGKLAKLLQFERMYDEVTAREKELRKEVTRLNQLVDSILGAVTKFSTKVLFGAAEDDQAARDLLRKNLTAGKSLQDGLRDVSILHHDRQSRPAFATSLSLLKSAKELAPHIGAGIEAGDYTIIDVGADPLAFERHVYAPMLKRRPSLVIGFDPMDKEAPRSVHSEGRGSTPPSEVRILPNIVLDGNRTELHIAKAQANSSTLTFNKQLAERFSQLAGALETVESREVETSRMDDILAGQGLAERDIDFLKINANGATLPVLKGSNETLKRTLVCQLEAEFSDIYQSECLFTDIDPYMRAAGFGLLDLVPTGRQRYAAFDPSSERLYHTGRILWSDCIYVRHLDEPSKLSDLELLKLAEIAHLNYEKYDVSAFALQEHSRRSGSSLYRDYLGLWA